MNIFILYQKKLGLSIFSGWPREWVNVLKVLKILFLLYKIFLFNAFKGIKSFCKKKKSLWFNDLLKIKI